MEQAKKLKILIAITRNSQLKLALGLRRRLSELNNDIIFLADDEKVSLPDREYAKSLSFYKRLDNTKFEDMRRDCFSLISSWPNQPLKKSFTLRQLTEYHNICLWEISYREILLILLPIIDKINMIELAIKTELPDRVVIFNTAGPLEKILISTCRNKRIPVEICNHHKLKKFTLNARAFVNPIRELLKEFKRFTVSIWHLIFNYFRQLRHKLLRPNVLFFATEERFLETLLPVIKLFSCKERLVINAVLPGSARALRKEKIFFMEFFGYLLNFPFNRKISVVVRRIISAVRDSKKFQESLTYKGIPLWDIINEALYDLIRDIFKNKMFILNCINRVILKYQPKVIVVPNNQPEIIAAAKNLGIPAVAIQCGAIGEFVSYGPTFVDTIATDGDYWKNILVNKGVSAEKIAVTGPPRFDVVFSNHNVPLRDKRMGFLRKTNLGDNDKVVVFATSDMNSSISLPRIQYQNLVYEIYTALKDLTDVRLITKIHPADSDFRMYREIAKKAGLENMLIVRDVDKQELLAACDVLIAFVVSTIAYEATILDKPVIYLSMAGYTPGVLTYDAWDLKDSQVAVCVRNTVELKNNLKQILYNPEAKDRMKETRRVYIREHLNFLGEASERVKKEIEAFL